MTISQPTTLQAIAAANGYNNSAVGAAQFVFQVQTPTFSPFPAPSPTPTPVTVTISCPTSGATIFYTLDGSTPVPGGSEYLGPIVISTNTVVKAIATLAGWTNSSVAELEYAVIAVGSGLTTLPFTKRTTAAIAVFRAMQIAAPAGAQMFASSTQVGQLSLSYGALLPLYRQICRQDVANQAYTLDEYIAQAVTQIGTLNTTVQSIAPTFANAPAVSALQLVTANTLAQIVQVSLAPDDGE